MFTLEFLFITMDNFLMQSKVFWRLKTLFASLNFADESFLNFFWNNFFDFIIFHYSVINFVIFFLFRYSIFFINIFFSLKNTVIIFLDFFFIFNEKLIYAFLCISFIIQKLCYIFC